MHTKALSGRLGHRLAILNGPALVDLPPPPTPPPPPPPPVALSGKEAFTPLSDPGLIGRVDQLDARHRSAVSLALQIVETEGPTPAINVVKRVANAFGVGRVSAARLNALWPLVRGVASTDVGFGEFLWPSTKSPEVWRGFRLTTNEQRPIADVAPEEVINYMEAITRVSLGIAREQLIVAAAAAFGNRRLADGIRGRLDGILDHAIATNRLVDAGSITVP